MDTEKFKKVFNEALKTGEKVTISKEYEHLVPILNTESNFQEIHLGESYLEKDIDSAINYYKEEISDINSKEALSDLLNADYVTKLNFINSKEFSLKSKNEVTNEGLLGKVCEYVCVPISKKISEKVCEMINGKMVCRIVVRIVVENSCKSICKAIPI